MNSTYTLAGTSKCWKFDLQEVGTWDLGLGSGCSAGLQEVEIWQPWTPTACINQYSTNPFACCRIQIDSKSSSQGPSTASSLTFGARFLCFDLLGFSVSKWN